MLSSGLIAAEGLLLIYAAWTKLRRPESLRDALRAIGISRAGWVTAVAGCELAAGLAAMLLQTRVSGPLLAGVFAVLAAVTWRLAQIGFQFGCGCFGYAERGPSRSKAALNLLAALLALLASRASAAGILVVIASRPAAGLLALALAAVASVLWRMALDRLNARGIGELSERVVTDSALFLERRISRRSALIRLVVAGSALSVAPLRYLLYPGTALAVVAPFDCAGGLCTDGYTAFCCEITGGLNQCPAGTFPGGWWKCTDYRGSQLCSDHGVRYYVDCNRLPNLGFPGGCQCANGSCRNRRVSCNVFRYGQCNTQINGTTEVVCRMVTCTNPGQIPGLNCGSSLSVDDAVCAHEAPCLQPHAVQLAGAGGV